MAETETRQELSLDEEMVCGLIGITLTNRERLRLLCEALHQAIDIALTPRQREIIRMYYFEQKRSVVIARELRITPSSVSRTKKRAEGVLRRSLAFYFAYFHREIDP